MDKRFLFKLVSVLGIPALAVLMAELLLAAVHYPTAYETEDPFLGFKSVTSLFERRPGGGPSGETVYRTRKSKLPWFNEQAFRAEKPENGYRIFTFGGSTTYGRPYDNTTSFSNWLRLLLEASDPSTHFEVVNAGGVSYASYRVVNLMNEIVGYDADLFIVYTGHNEFLEHRTYSDILEEPPIVTRLRTRLHRSRAYSLARDVWRGVQGVRVEPAQEEKYEMAGEVTAILDQSLGLDQYHRDPAQTEAILEHFRYNLRRMVDIARAHDVPLILVVPPSNEKDFSPFKSELCGSLPGDRRERWSRLYEAGRVALSRGEYGAAEEALRRALELDSCHADLHYRLGEALFALGRYEDAKEEFDRASDSDVAPLRAKSRIQQTVRDVAREREVPVMDLVRLLEQRNARELGHDILGREAFLDHAHPRIWVHQELAEELDRMLVERSWIRPERTLAEAEAAALYDSLMATLDSAYYATRDLNLAKVLTWLGKTEEAAVFVNRAAAGLPDHPEAQYLQGTLFEYAGQLERAERAYQRAIALDSTFSRAHDALAGVYARTGRLDEATASIRRALRYEPGSDHAYFNLGNTLYQAGRAADAVEAYKRALRLNPRHSKAWNNLAAVYITEHDYDEAIQALRKALELEPDNRRAYNNLGLAYYHKGELEPARQAFEATLQISPGDAYALGWLERLGTEARP